MAGSSARSRSPVLPAEIANERGVPEFAVVLVLSALHDRGLLAAEAVEWSTAHETTEAVVRQVGDDRLVGLLDDEQPVAVPTGDL